MLIGWSVAGDDMLDLKPLLRTLSKVSAGRVVEWAEHTAADDLHSARIPVKFVDETDKTDAALRRYAKDWLKKREDRVAVDTRFQPLRGAEATFTDDEGNTFPICGVILLRWWPKPELSEKELREIEWFAAQTRKRAQFSD
jgi:hypothetical protein